MVEDDLIIRVQVYRKSSKQVLLQLVGRPSDEIIEWHADVDNRKVCADGELTGLVVHPQFEKYSKFKQ